MLRVVTQLTGGPGRHVLGVTRALGTEWPALVATGRTQSTDEGPGEAELRVERLPLESGLVPMRDIRALRGLERLVASEGPWLVETHGFKPGVLGRQAAFRSRTRPMTLSVSMA